MTRYIKNFERMLKTTDDVGIVQHSKGAVPDLDFGYSIDDQARALIVCSRLYPWYDDCGKHLKYLDYIKNARRDDGFFYNFFEEKDDRWGYREESYDQYRDCFGRTIWALSEFAGSNFPIQEREEALEIINSSIHNNSLLKYNLSKAFTVIGLTKLQVKNHEVVGMINNLTDDLLSRFIENYKQEIPWFSLQMDYCNGCLPQAMVAAYSATGDNEYLIAAESSLDFLTRNSFDHLGHFNAIGNKGFYKIGSEIPRYDQQSIEAACFVEACVDIIKVIDNRKKREHYIKTAHNAMQWYFGDNIANEPMLDKETGGAYDAITERDINKNQGAESIVGYLMAETKMDEIERMFV